MNFPRRNDAFQVYFTHINDIVRLNGLSKLMFGEC